MEQEKPRSDSPTISPDMTKTVVAIAANEDWKAECLDVTAAFLQGEELEREVFVKPPPEEAIEGHIWKLNKAAYGLYDSARKWYLNVIEELEKNKMRSVTGDDAVFYYRINDKTEGIVALHVDDFLAVGSPIFFENVMKNIKTAFKFHLLTYGPLHEWFDRRRD